LNLMRLDQPSDAAETPGRSFAARSGKVDALGTRVIRSRVWTAGRLLLLAGALAITYGIFFLATMRVVTRARDVKVPDVRGKLVTEANAALANAGLALRIDPLRRPDPTVPVDRVLSQDPEPGTIVRRSRSVRVRVSEGAHAPVVPALTGLSERAAQLTLTQERIQLASTAAIRTTDYEPGVIVAQDPPPKTRAGAIMLLVNRAQGGASYVMPDLIGTPGGRSADVLRKQGFVVAIVGETPYPGLPSGIVIRQAPQPGFQIASGEPISLEVSR
jgi:eukaryotic-like serine/threonine-protein kinase